MKISKYEISCNILNIEVEDENDITEQLLKRKYHKCCLQYHPDKNKQITSKKFLEVNDAYDYLCKYLGYTDDDNYDDYDDYYNNDVPIPIIVNPYIKVVGKIILTNEFIVSYVNSMNDCSFKTLFKIFERTCDNKY